MTIPVYAIDFETYYEPGLGIKDLGVGGYVNHPKFDAYMVSLVGPGIEFVGHPKDAPWHLLPEVFDFVAHNMGFDRQVYGRLQKDFAGFYPTARRWWCTANLAVFLNADRNLKGASDQLLGIKVDKQMRGYMNGKTWADAVADGKDQELLKYALDDSVNCLAIWNKYNHLWPEAERQVAEITYLQTVRGLGVDEPLLDKGITSVGQAKDAAFRNIPWRNDLDDSGEEIKPTSVLALRRYCDTIGIPRPKKTAAEEPELELWLNQHECMKPILHSMQQYRSTNALLKKALVLKSRIRESDGRFPFESKYFGAHCFTGDHEVLTELGWVRLDNWNGGRIVMRNHDGSLRWGSAVANSFPLPEEECLVRVKTNKLSMLMTRGHWMAAVSKKGVLFGRQAGDAFGHELTIPISGVLSNGVEELSPDQIRLIAAVQADGSYFTTHRAIRFDFVKERKITRLRSILSALPGLEWVEKNYSDRTHFEVRAYPVWLENRKRFGVEWLRYTARSRDVLLGELEHWDGYRVSPSCVEYVTGVKENSELVATLAHLSGKAATVIERKGVGNRKVSYRVVLRNVDKSRISASSWSEEWTGEGRVYCPTSETGVVLFRHNGKIFISKQTGRWSGGWEDERAGSTGFNYQNLPSSEMYGLDLRRCLIPSPGYKYVIADFAQIEPRCLLWLVDDWDTLGLVKQGYSIYEAYARKNLGWTGGDLKKAASTDAYAKNLYKTAKAAVLGGGYGCGAAKFIMVAKMMADLDIDLETATKIVGDFRRSNPKITQFWRTLEMAMKREARGNFSIELPSGRSLTYYDVKLAGGLTAVIGLGGKRYKFWGGVLTENVCQAVARDVIRDAIINLEAAGIKTLFTVHDEVICEVPVDFDSNRVREIMVQEPSWMPGLPLEVSLEDSMFYKK